MRIGFDAKRYFHNRTGLGNFSRNLVQSLAQNHTEENWFLLDSKGGEMPSDLNLQLITPSRKTLLWRQIGISGEIERLKLNVFHGLSAELPLSRPRNCALVVTVHDLIFLKLPKNYRTADRFIYTYKLRNAMEQADVIVCTSEVTKHDLIEIFPRFKNKLRVLYQACDQQFYTKFNVDVLDDFRQQQNLPAEFILCLSSFEKRKNQINLLKAYALLKGEKPDLVLAGRPGDFMREIENFIRENNLTDKVRLMTNLPVENLNFLIQASTFCVFPSMYEGFGIPVLECMAAGRLVLTSKDSSMSEITGDGDFLFDPKSPESIAENLQNAFNEDHRNTSLEIQQNQLPNFRSELIAEQHMNLYREIAG
ncbi:MAG: glycosyltransferase [Bacteroidetes bacterium]|nr:glycosyltransferase [Bacteroidota bacterium]